MNKRVALLLITMLATSSLILIESTYAQSIPKPSVPEFSLRVVAHPYDVPPTYGIDPYTGKNKITNYGYHVDNKSIEIIIKNQPFASSIDGTKYYLFYTVRMKGHFEEGWTVLYQQEDFVSDGSVPIQSSSDYTVISIAADNFAEDGQFDFQVEAMVGTDIQIGVMEQMLPSGGVIPGHYEPGIAIKGKSGWSSTQTIIIPASSKSTNSPSPSSTSDQTAKPSPSQTTAPASNDASQTLQSGIIGIVVTIVLVIVGLLIYYKKRRHQTIPLPPALHNN